jgi:plastocyanin
MTRNRPLLIAAALGLAALGAALAGVVAHADTKTTTVNVGEREFKITLSRHTVAPGATTFVVRNTGKYPHSLAIAGPGVKTKKTPLIKPGKSARLTVALEAGTYSLWCPVPGHAARGMKAKLVAGAATGTTTTTDTDTDTTDTTTTTRYPGY